MPAAHPAQALWCRVFGHFGEETIENAFARHQALLSVEEYLAGEESAECRREYLAGEVYAVSGTGARHSAICVNLVTALHRHLAGGPCRVFMGDLTVRLKALNEDYFYYPDAKRIPARNTPNRPK